MNSLTLYQACQYHTEKPQKQILNHFFFKQMPKLFLQKVIMLHCFQDYEGLRQRSLFSNSNIQTGNFKLRSHWVSMRETVAQYFSDENCITYFSCTQQVINTIYFLFL